MAVYDDDLGAGSVHPLQAFGGEDLLDGAGFQDANFQHPGGQNGAAGGHGNGQEAGSQGAYEDVDYEVVNDEK